MTSVHRRLRREQERREKKVAKVDDATRRALADLHVRLQRLTEHPRQQDMLLLSRQLIATYEGLIDVEG
jgi:hypothetical protein